MGEYLWLFTGYLLLHLKFGCSCITVTVYVHLKKDQAFILIICFLFLQQLVENYSLSLKLAIEIVDEAVDNLRQHAVKKWSAIQRFNEKGIATLKVRLTGNIPNNVSDGLV